MLLVCTDTGQRDLLCDAERCSLVSVEANVAHGLADIGAYTDHQPNTHR